MGSSISKSHRWHSMEDARKSKSTVCQLPRGSSCSPSCDVWATREFGIPLSELGNAARGKKVGESLAIAVTAESDVNPDVGANDSKKELSKEGEEVRVESDVKNPRPVSSSSSSSSSLSSATSRIRTTLSHATNDASSSRNESARLINANLEIEKSDRSSRGDG